MQLKKKWIILITATVLVSLVGAIIGVCVYGCKKQGPLDDKLYKQTKIAFVSKKGRKDGSSDIYIMNGDGTVKRRLTDNCALHMVLSWSPDGRKIA